jgi:hypothetical protein
MLTDLEVEGLENSVSVVVGAAPADEAGETELLGVSVGVPVAVVAVAVVSLDPLSCWLAAAQ